MNVRSLFSASLAGLTLSYTAAAPAWAQAVTIPPVPTAPKILPFDDEVAGRRLLFAAQDAVRAVPAFGFTARFSVASATGKGGSAATVYTGTETLKSELSARRLALTTETARGKEKEIRRAIADGNNLIGTRFQDSGNGKPGRSVIRLPLDPTTDVPRALRAIDFSTQTAGSELLLDPDSPDDRQATVWRGKDLTEKGGRYAVVLESARPSGERTRTTVSTRRYTLDPKTHRLFRFEEWLTTQERPRPARRGQPADDGYRVTYHREDYSGYPVASVTAFPTTVYAQSVPHNYEERSVPANRQPDPSRILENADPRALALLAKWRKGQERFLSLNADITQNIRMTPRTASSLPVPSEWRNRTIRYGVQVRRTGLTRFVQDVPPVTPDPNEAGMRFRFRGGAGQSPRSVTIISDGKMLCAVDRASNNYRTRALRDSDELWNRIAQSGVSDWGGGLSWIYEGVLDPEDFTRIAYEGRTQLDNGESVEVIVLEQSVESDGTMGGGFRRRGRGGGNGPITEQVERYRVGLGADGLPRMIEYRRQTDVSGQMERDQQPILTVLTRYNSVRVDAEPAASTFILPAAATASKR
jgi:hypothetical protein